MLSVCLSYMQLSQQIKVCVKTACVPSDCACKTEHEATRHHMAATDASNSKNAISNDNLSDFASLAFFMVAHGRLRHLKSKIFRPIRQYFPLLKSTWHWSACCKPFLRYSKTWIGSKEYEQTIFKESTTIFAFIQQSLYAEVTAAFDLKVARSMSCSMCSRAESLSIYYAIAGRTADEPRPAGRMFYFSTEYNLEFGLKLFSLKCAVT